MTKLSKFIALVLLLSPLTSLFSQSHDACSHKSKYVNLHSQAKSAQSITIDRFDVHYYKLDLHLERNSNFIEGNVQIISEVTSPSLDTFVVSLHRNHSIDSIQFNGVKTTYIYSNDVLRIPVLGGLTQGSIMNVVIYYAGNAPTGGSSAIGQGFSTGTSGAWGNEVTWSLSQPYSAYEWFPVKQDLQDKADSVEVWVTTDNTNKVGSNGVLMAVTPMPNSKVRYEWKSNYPIAYYLISIAVAEYIDYTIYAHPAGTTDSIKIVNYIYNNPQTLPYFQAEIDKTASMLEVFSEKFGLYPFHKEKYGHSMAPFSGGMEHQTMTSQGFFFTDLTSHELAHQWFGDDVTCASWKDIFLNEGFASYLEYVYLQAKEPSNARTWIDDTHAAALVQDGSVYVDDTSDVSRIFSSALSYNKGAFLLHMLRYEINDDAMYYDALKTYRNTYSGGTATGLEFKDVMETETSMDFTDFFDQWYFGEGYPIMNVTYNKVGNTIHLRVEQTVTAPFVTELFKTHFDLKLNFTDRPDTTVRLYMDEHVEKYLIEEVSGTMVQPEVDPEQWLLNGDGIMTYDPTLGVQLLSGQKGISIYPNPTSKEVIIDFYENKKQVEIRVINLSGQLVYETIFESGNRFQFDLNQVPGIYLLQLKYEDGSEEEFKLIKE